MTLLTSNENQMKWYIETPTGLVGPFNSPEEANVSKLHEGLQGQIVSRTNSGQSMLLG